MKAGRLFVGIKNTQVMLSVCVMLMGLLVVSMSAQGLVTVTKQITGLDANGYFVNGTPELSVQVTINYDGSEGTITALGYEEIIPPGFSYLGPLATENPTPPIVPNFGQTNTLSFAYIFVPTFPATFTYRIACPLTICEPGQLVGTVAYRLTGPQLESAPTTNTIQLEPTNLTFTRELSGPGVAGTTNMYYVPGETIDVTIHIDKEGPQDITALGFQDTLPAGWTYVGPSNTDTLPPGFPPVFPPAGQTDLLEFAYVSVPAFPVEFTYTVQVPADESGPVTIGGDIVVGTETKSSAVVYRTCGDSIFSPKVETLLNGIVPCILVSRSFTHNYYVPGEVVEVTINFRIDPDHPCGEAVQALGYAETIPAGWTYEGPLATENPTPPIVPNANATGTLDFAYIFVPTLTGNGSSFTYRIRAAADSSGPQQLSGYAKYRLSGGELQSDVVVSELIDDTPPEITLNGDPEVTVECGSVYDDAGATATDIPDGDLTAQIIVTNNVNIAVVGDYTVDYSVTDSSNHTTTAQRIVHVVDMTKPVITLNGANPMTVECNSLFVDPGATATDNCDTNVTVNVGGTVDTAAVGEYILTYTATDASGNEADPVTRTVQVVDTTPPLITLIGPNPYLSAQCGNNYNDPGATATDICDGNVSVTNDASTAVNIHEPGNYTVTFRAEDSHGNISTTTRQVQVIDTTPPVVTITGANPMTVQCGSTFEEPTVTATDTCDGALSISTAGSVDTTTPDSYIITYSATDSSGNTGTAVLTINVEDTTPPVITLNGGEIIDHECGSPFVDPGATALDACEGVVEVITSGYVYENQVGDYTLSYTATDSNTNSAKRTRTVHVVDTQGPVITLNQDEMEIECSVGVFEDPGAVAADACEDIVQVLTAAGIYELPTMNKVESIDTTVAGKEYIVRYVAEDNAEPAKGNQSTKDMPVRIVDTTPPVITLNGDNPMTVERGSIFTDPGATVTDSCDSSVTVIATGTVDTSVVGVYTITYTATDVSGNSTTVTRTVNVVISDTPPVITLLGEPEVTVECGTLYEDEGATALDDKDGDLTEQIQIQNNVDASVPGNYTVVYSVTDSAGNTATAQRVVIVADTQGPIITLNEDEMEIECGDVFEDPGARAADACEGTVQVLTAAGIYETATMDEVESIDTSAVGKEYIVRYVAEDSQGNQSTADMPVQIVDTTPPVITLLGDNPMTVECNSTFTDPGATAADSCNTSPLAVTLTGDVDTTTPGSYQITYSSTDASGNTGTAVRTVNVVDTVSPVITLLGDNLMTVECGSSFPDPGATATDSCDSSVTVIATSTVNTNVVGNYTIIYNATDAFGNIAEPVIRTVQVVDTQKPIITLLGANPMTVECKSTFTDPGTTVTDSCDSSVTVTATGTVNTNVVGNYTITYTATDASGNSAESKTRTVQVVDTKKPVITLNGASEIRITVGDAFTDPGATATDDCAGSLEITTSGSVNTSVAATYELVYTATDPSGNKAEAKRTVIVEEVAAGNLEITTSSGSPNIINFGNDLQVNKTYMQKIILYNRGNIPINVAVTLINSGNGVFSLNYGKADINIPAGGVKYIDVTCTPKEAGEIKGRVQLIASDNVTPTQPPKYIDLIGTVQAKGCGCAQQPSTIAYVVGGILLFLFGWLAYMDIGCCG